MIFLNMDSEIVYLFLFDSREGIFERSKNWLWMGKKHDFTISHKSLCEDAKICQSQYFCRPNTSLQNVISH